MTMDRERVRTGTMNRLRSKHPGFASVQESISKREGISKDRAGAILASAGRKSSAKARKKNPRLNRIRGAKY